MTMTHDRLKGLCQGTLPQLRLARELIAELDRIGLADSRPLKLALELQQELTCCEQDLFLAARLPASSRADMTGGREQPRCAPLATEEPAAQTRLTPLAPFVPLEVRAAGIDPHTTLCFNGYYGEDFGDQRVVTRALVWASPEFDDAVPDWAMRDAWPELAGEWDVLLAAAWGRSHPPASPQGETV
jgi:hypothetical protein